MENPATWGKAEHVVQDVINRYMENRMKPPAERTIGLSMARQITDALREAGFDLADEEDADGHQ